jgi:hypothetical protein
VLTRRAASRLRRDPRLAERLMTLIGAVSVPRQPASAFVLARLLV